MDRQSALDYVARWNKSDYVQTNAYRSESYEVKYQQLITLFRIAKKFGWSRQSDNTEIAIWERWASMKENYERDSRK